MSPGPETIQERLGIVVQKHAAAQAKAHFEFAAGSLDESIVTNSNIDRQVAEAARQATFATEWLKAATK